MIFFEFLPVETYPTNKLQLWACLKTLNVSLEKNHSFSKKTKNCKFFNYLSIPVASNKIFAWKSSKNTSRSQNWRNINCSVCERSWQTSNKNNGIVGVEKFPPVCNMADVQRKRYKEEIKNMVEVFYEIYHVEILPALKVWNLKELSSQQMMQIYGMVREWI